MYVQYPVLIYDNLCTSCTNFAKIINRLLNGKITMLGHHTLQGRQFKQKIFPENYNGLEMSWFVTETKAYGGRKILQQLVKYKFSRKSIVYPINSFDLDECTANCNTVKNVMFRSCSLLSTSKIIEYTK